MGQRSILQPRVARSERLRVTLPSPSSSHVPMNALPVWPPVGIALPTSAVSAPWAPLRIESTTSGAVPDQSKLSRPLRTGVGWPESWRLAGEPSERQRC